MAALRSGMHVHAQVCMGVLRCGERQANKAPPQGGLNGNFAPRRQAAAPARVRVDFMRNPSFWLILARKNACAQLSMARANGHILRR